jgi:hypothetical protein
MKTFDKLLQYRFEFWHLTVLFGVLIAFQIILSVVHKATLHSSLSKTQEWYQKDSAEKLAHVTATSLELIFETVSSRPKQTDSEAQSVVQAFDIILSQQMLGRNAKEICILVSRNGKTYAIDDGEVLFAFLNDRLSNPSHPQKPHAAAVALYDKYKEQLRKKEEIFSILEGRQTFHTFVPFVPRGEFVGVVYVKNSPDFSFITSSFTTNYDETSLINTSLMFLGLLAMYYISSYTVKERDKAQRLFYEEHEKLLKEKIDHEKEFFFTKRIYHTHHKAEKVMAFIKQDLLVLSAENIEQIKYRITKYANFISRVIYDMKWYEPPVQTIRNPLFMTDINEVIRFIVDHLFLRLSKTTAQFTFALHLGENIPIVHVNEFVIWEIIEPLIQNSITHSEARSVTVTITTHYDPASGITRVFLDDNGKGIPPELLQRNRDGIRNIFLENVSTKTLNGEHTGYGCYIAYEMAKIRCAWDIEAENLDTGGTRIMVTIPNT